MHDPITTQDRLRRFEQLILPHFESALNLARWLMSNREDAKDIVQDAYLRAFRSFDSLRGESARAWFLTIVRNACFTARAKSRTKHQHEPFDDEITETSAEPFPGWSCPSADPLAHLEQRNNLELVQLLIRSLPPEYREILILREVEELSYKTIAEISGLPIGTVMSRLSRARALLESKLNVHFTDRNEK